MSNYNDKVLFPIATILISAIIIGFIAFFNESIGEKVDKDVHTVVHDSDNRREHIIDKHIDILLNQQAVQASEYREFKINNKMQYEKILKAINSNGKLQ